MPTFTEKDLAKNVPGSSFTYYDVLYSDTARSNGLLNLQYNPSSEIVTSINDLFKNIVTPLETQFPGQIKVNSCYRHPNVDLAVSGKTNPGQHSRGQAIDITGINGLTNQQLFNYICSNLPYDQLIWEINSSGGTDPLTGEPRWVHVSFNNTKSPKSGAGGQRKSTLFGNTKVNPVKYQQIKCSTSTGPNSKPDQVEAGTEEGISSAGSGAGSNTAGTLSNNNSNKNLSSSPDNNSATDQGPSFKATFQQIERNTNNIESDNVPADITWGKRINPQEDSDWIDLKQFLLYLSSRYTPQSLFPFVELIPILTVETSENASTAVLDSLQERKLIDKDGNLSEEIASKVKDQGQLQKIKNLANKLQEAKKFQGEPPPGYTSEKFKTGADATNKASGVADLFNLDPFQEGMKFIGEPSESGKIVEKQRNVGYRIYSQLVLTPAPIDGVSSKPGAIGFTDLEIQAGNQQDNGLAMINMTLLDVQGNKFTDINSPWSFIFDVRPGSLGGDFWFRYGWQIRVPDPNDRDDTSSYGFWNHPGWELFGQDVKRQIIGSIIPLKQVITLTQSVNVGPTLEPNSSDNTDLNQISIFDEGIIFNPESGEVTIERRNLNDSNYVRLSLLNPELSMQESGALEAKLSFRTTGAITANVPMIYASNTKKLVASYGTTLKLGDLILGVSSDMANFGFLGIKDSKQRQRQYEFSNKQLKSIGNSRRFDNYVYITGLTKSGNNSNIHPDEIKIKIPSKLAKQLTSSDVENPVTIIAWFRSILEENDCVLMSPATGSGSGINSAWIISTTQKLEDRYTAPTLSKRDESQPVEKLINTLVTEKDVFSFRFQGSLVSNIKVEKTQAPNAMSIRADHTVNDFATYDVTSGNAPEDITKPVTAIDKKRNLLAIFSQMQNVTIDALCHPWLGPGKRVYVKGMGFWDGEYLVTSVTHKLQGHMFTTNLLGARILLENQDQVKDDKQTVAENGNQNFTQPVTNQFTNQKDVKTGQTQNQQKVSNSIPLQTDKLVTVDQLYQIAKTKNKQAIESIIDPLNDTLKKYNITSYLRICHFLAQVMHESGGFSWYKEFGTGQAYEGRVDLGNLQPGDGAKFKGRGAIQITGKTNYTNISNSLGQDFVNNPNLLEQRTWGTSTAGWFWDRKTLNTLADKDDLLSITKAVNGGINGLSSRSEILTKAKDVISKTVGQNLTT